MEATLTVTEAAGNFAEVVDRTHRLREATTLLENGKPVARVVPTARAMKTGKQIAAAMTVNRPRLGVEEAAAFEADLRETRAGTPGPIPSWD